MRDFEVRGAEKLAKVAKDLKRLGDKDLSKELYAGLNRATKPMRANAKKSAQDNLPRAGGLNKRVARARFSTRRKTGRNPGVQIVAKGMDQLELMNRGFVRHPVYGNRGRWVNQPIPDAEDWFTKPMEDGKPEAQREIVKALDNVAKKIPRNY